MMTVAQVLSQDNFDTDVLLDKHLDNLGAGYLKKELSDRFGLNLGKINFIKGPVGKGSSFFQRLFFPSTTTRANPSPSLGPASHQDAASS